MQLQFRLKGRQSMADIDPARIEAAVGSCEVVESHELFDHRLSDATFVTLRVKLRAAGPAELATLHRALTSLAGLDVYAVAPSGALTPLRGLAPDRLPEAARVGPKP